MSNDQQPADSYDVAILGGGLAGFTLGLQLKQPRPDTSIFIAEKREGPAPEAAFKVGESTQEISCDYFGERARLQGPSRERADHEDRPALLVPRRATTATSPSASSAARRSTRPSTATSSTAGASRTSSASRRSQPGSTSSAAPASRTSSSATTSTRSRYTLGGNESTDERKVKARWIVDASGRAFTLKQQARAARGQRPRHQRVLVQARRRARPRGLGRPQRRGVLRPHGGARRPQAQHQPRLRAGLLGLADPALLGADLDRHLRRPAVPSLRGVRTRSRARSTGSGEHEPQLAESIESRGRDQVEDFLKVADFSYGCKQVFSGSDRWCLVGEAGRVPRPVLLAGVRLHRVSNTLTTDLVTRDSTART